jgi:DNA-binding MarR family transcriptional regulator
MIVAYKYRHDPETPTMTRHPSRGAVTDPASRLAALVRGLVRRFSISERADVACCGMTVAQAATLDTLRAEGPLRLGDLGRRLGVSPSTLTRNLERLEGRGLVARTPDPRDSRASAAALTAAGRRAAARVGRQDAVFARGVLERLEPSRRDATLDALTDLLAAVRSATEACCPGAFDHLMQDFPTTQTISRGTARARRTRP